MRRDLPLAGFFLVAAGVLLLLGNLGVLSEVTHWLWAALFGLGGLFFILHYLQRRTEWWALIPGVALLSLGAIIVVQDLAPESDWAGPLFLAGLGLAYLLVHFVAPGNWWAIIPGGVLSTLAAVAWVEPRIAGVPGGGVFFSGLALTFLFVHLSSGPIANRRWALIPALVLAVLSLQIFSTHAGLAGLIWPTALIAAGGYLLYSALRSRAARKN